MNFEFFKIACGFELALKAILLKNGIVIQILNKTDPLCEKLEKEQKKRPIRKEEVIAIDDFRFDGTECYLPGLTKSSLNFSTITQRDAYRKLTGLNNYALGLIDEFRELRNQIHFPGELPLTPRLQAHSGSQIDFILNFINSQLVDRVQELVIRHNFYNQNLIARIT